MINGEKKNVQIGDCNSFVRGVLILEISLNISTSLPSIHSLLWRIKSVSGFSAENPSSCRTVCIKVSESNPR